MLKKTKNKNKFINGIDTFIQMIKLTRAHIGLVVLPSFWLGSLFALRLGYDFNLFIFFIGFIIIFLIYASASYINDYYDFKADQYNRQYGFSGGSGVLQKHPELKEITKWSAIGFIILSLLLTLWLAFFSVIPLWSIGYIGLGAFFSYFYSAPPVRLSYRGVGEIPHFLAGMMNTGWGYLLFTGFIDLDIIIFSIPLSFHLLTVILIFEIPDKEADVHGGKQNFIVNHGRKNSFLLITLLFWFTSLYYFFLAYSGWYSTFINFNLLAFLSLIPSLISSMIYLKKPVEKNIATKSAIQNALSLFLFSISILIYFIILEL